MSLGIALGDLGRYDEAARTYLTMAEDLTDARLLSDLRELQARAGESLIADGIPADEHEVTVGWRFTSLSSGRCVRLLLTPRRDNRKGVGAPTRQPATCSRRSRCPVRR